MPKRKYFEIAAFPLSGPEVYRALLTKYAIIIAFATSSIPYGVPTLNLVAGRWFGSVWALLLLAVTMTAVVGVVRSRHTGKINIEFTGTLLVIAGFVGYAAAIVWRFFMHWDWVILPTALVPIVLSVFPFWRLRAILKRPHGGPPATPASGNSTVTADPAPSLESAGGADE